MVRDMTEGNESKQIILFTLPLLLGNIFQQFYSLIDSVIVGKFVGTNAFAAVGSTGSISFLILGFVSGICSGFCIPIAQFRGANDYTNLRKTVANIIYLAVIISAALTTITIIFTRPMLELMNTPDDIIDDAYNYIIVIFAGMTATMFYNILAGMLRALGDSRSPLIFLIIATVLNVILDIIFTLVINMRVSGVAFATICAQFISGILCLIFIIKKRNIFNLTLSKSDFQPSFALMKRLLALGLPMAFQFSITAVGSIILQTAVNGLGSTYVAAVSGANKVSNIFTQPMDSLGAAMATFVGQNRGACRLDRIKKGVRNTSIISVIYSIFAMIVLWLFGGNISLIFLDAKETIVIEAVEKMLRIITVFYPFLAVLFIYRNSIQGMGYGVPAMLAGVFELVARSVIGSVFVPVYKYTAACFASPVAWVAAVILLIPVYYIVIHRLNKRGMSQRT